MFPIPVSPANENARVQVTWLTSRIRFESLFVLAPNDRQDGADKT